MYAARKAMMAPTGGIPALLDPDNPDILGMWLNGTPISGSTLFDDTVNNNDGTITGATEVAGHDGIALMFDAPTEGVNMGNVIDITTGDFSIWSLVKTSDTTKDKSVVQKRTSDSGGAGYLLTVVTSGAIAALASSPTVDASVVSTGLVNDGNYHFIGVNFDRSANLTLHIDGPADGTIAISTVVSMTNDGVFVIGNKSSMSTASSDFIGDIDITLVMNRLATQTEIDDAVSFLGL
jgi:hypothetical protein